MALAGSVLPHSLRETSLERSTVRLLYDAGIPASVLLSKSGPLAGNDRDQSLGYVTEQIHSRLGGYSGSTARTNYRRIDSFDSSRRRKLYTEGRSSGGVRSTPCATANNSYGGLHCGSVRQLPFPVNPESRHNPKEDRFRNGLSAPARAGA